MEGRKALHRQDCTLRDASSTGTELKCYSVEDKPTESCEGAGRTAPGRQLKG